MPLRFLHHHLQVTLPCYVDGHRLFAVLLSGSGSEKSSAASFHSSAFNSSPASIRAIGDSLGIRRTKARSDSGATKRVSAVLAPGDIKDRDIAERKRQQRQQQSLQRRIVRQSQNKTRGGQESQQSVINSKPKTVSEHCTDSLITTTTATTTTKPITNTVENSVIKTNTSDIER